MNAKRRKDVVAEAATGKAPVVQITLMLRGYFDADEGLHYIESPTLDLIRAGRSVEEVKADFLEALDILVDGWLKRGTLMSRLTE